MKNADMPALDAAAPISKLDYTASRILAALMADVNTVTQDVEAPHVQEAIQQLARVARLGAQVLLEQLGGPATSGLTAREYAAVSTMGLQMYTYARGLDPETHWGQVSLQDRARASVLAASALFPETQQ